MKLRQLPYPERVAMARQWLKGEPSDSRATLADAMVQIHGISPEDAWKLLEDRQSAS